MESHSSATFNQKLRRPSAVPKRNILWARLGHKRKLRRVPKSQEQRILDIVKGVPVGRA